MEPLIFATNNENKVKEIKHVLQNRYNVLSLKEAKINVDIPEPYDTLEENARAKSKTIYELTGKNCFSEDTGLEVDALHGEPGVKSARYAGDNKDFTANTQKLLQNLLGSVNRKARFRTVISLLLNGEEQLFEGICEGTIATFPKGEKGFGYDSVFVPLGATKTFGEMDIAEKNIYSHRKIATLKLLQKLSPDGKNEFH